MSKDKEGSSCVSFLRLLLSFCCHSSKTANFESTETAEPRGPEAAIAAAAKQFRQKVRFA
ncbi:hypothetical protein DITRI_Ditri11bG0026100 [Diplodiscus trichospermus]